MKQELTGRLIEYDRSRRLAAQLGEMARPVVGRAVRLSVGGVLLTAGLVGVFCHLVLGFGWTEGLLLGGYSPEWVADFLSRHFRGTVIDWVIHRGGYALWPKLEEDYVLFARFFRHAGPA